MGRASRRKRERQTERLADAHKFRVVVCAYPDSSLAPVAGLLKAATLYGDEVVLHHPTATMLASIASIGVLGEVDFVKAMAEIAPHLGPDGDGLARALTKLEADHGAGTAPLILGALLDPASPVGTVVSAVDPAAAKGIVEQQQAFASMRSQLNEVIEAQLAAAGVDELIPAVERGLLTLAPIAEQADFFDGYMDALWGLLRDSRYYPLLDQGMAELVYAAVREGAFDPPTTARSRGRQVAGAHDFLARLPTFPLARMDEIIDVRLELRKPLTVFRSEMVRLARAMTVDAFDPAFASEAEEAWVERVAPALLELDELVEEKRLHRAFGRQAGGGGAIGAVGGLVTGLVTKEAVFAASVGAAVATASTMVNAVALQRKIASEVRRRPYFFLYGTEEFLSARRSA